MQATKLMEAIEHLEKAKALLFNREMQETPFDDVVHAAIMSIGFHVKMLHNELALIERANLEKYKRGARRSEQIRDMLDNSELEEVARIDAE